MALHFVSRGRDKASSSDAAFAVLKLQAGFIQDEGCTLAESYLLFKQSGSAGKERTQFKFYPAARDC